MNVKYAHLFLTLLIIVFVMAGCDNSQFTRHFLSCEIASPMFGRNGSIRGTVYGDSFWFL